MVKENFAKKTTTMIASNFVREQLRRGILYKQAHN